MGIWERRPENEAGLMKNRPASPHDMAIDEHGNPLPHSPTEVQAIVRRALDKGTLHAAIMEDEHGNLCVQVFGPPSRVLLEALETTVRAYRRVLQGH